MPPYVSPAAAERAVKAYTATAEVAREVADSTTAAVEQLHLAVRAAADAAADWLGRQQAEPLPHFSNISVQCLMEKKQ